MPAKPVKASKASAKKAPRSKQWIYTFYLVQPVLQFLAIVVIVLAFARCSPLAPSTMKEGPQAVKTEPSESASQRAEEQAREDAILKSLTEMDHSPLLITSEEDILDLSKDVPHVENPVDENTIKKLFERRGSLKAQNKPKVLYLTLKEEEKAQFFQTGQLRLDVTEKLRLVEKAKQQFLKNVKKSISGKEIGASIHLVMPNNTMQRVNGAFEDLDVHIKMSLGMPSDDKLFLHLEKLPEDPAKVQDNAVLLDAALQESLGLVLFLE